MPRMRSLLLVIAMLAAAGCQTQFLGNAHIDPATCQARCTADHLQMSGMVYMGEYSSACICEVPREEPQALPPPRMPAGPPDGPPSGGASGATALAPGSLGASAGVIMQMRANQHAASQTTWTPHR